MERREEEKKERKNGGEGECGSVGRENYLPNTWSIF